MNRLRFIYLFLCWMLVMPQLYAQTPLTIKVNPAVLNYIDQYCTVAIEEMKRSGIPASVTLAQGIYESGAGSSRLAREANNHFGIKCHSNWEGEKVFHDDDESDECFRAYKNVEESFEDHSKFLLKERYSDLFKLNIDDYKS